jgi:hypothetical protein
MPTRIERVAHESGLNPCLLLLNSFDLTSLSCLCVFCAGRRSRSAWTASRHKSRLGESIGVRRLDRGRTEVEADPLAQRCMPQEWG